MRLSNKQKIVILVILGLLLLPLVLFAQTSNSNGKPKDGCNNGIWERSEEGESYKWICNSMLPLTITDIKAINIIDNIIKLEWKVTNIINHNYYIVEHSTDCIKWNSIRQTAAQFIYHRSKNQENYYRLTSVDLDQTRHTYPIVYCRIKTYQDLIYNLAGQQTNKESNKLLIINGFKTIIR